MVERRDVLRGTAAFAVSSIVGERESAAKDDDALDLALERFAGTGPEYRGGLANHGPMAAEALVALGRSDAVARWVEGYASRLGPPLSAGDPIPGAGWEAVLGRRERVGDWASFFRRELAEAPWPQVLRLWVPRLAPGFVAAATHGAIRTGHAARALGVTPCSTSVTTMALKIFDSFSFGARPVSSRNAMSPRLRWPRISFGRSLPRTTMRSGVDQPSSERISRAINRP